MHRCIDCTHQLTRLIRPEAQSGATKSRARTWKQGSGRADEFAVSFTSDSQSQVPRQLELNFELKE